MRCAGIPADDFDKNDWDSLRVAIRIVYETEEIRVALQRKSSSEWISSSAS
jgi:hypothetical protein